MLAARRATQDLCSPEGALDLFLPKGKKAPIVLVTLHLPATRLACVTMYSAGTLICYRGGSLEGLLDGIEMCHRKDQLRH